MHESFESPGAIETWAKKKNHTLSYTRFYKNDPLPENIDELDFLVVMGAHKALQLLRKNVHISTQKKKLNL